MRRWRSWIVAAAIVSAWLAIARPWTIRPIAAVPSGVFDAHEYVARIWDTRVLPALGSKAQPLDVFRDARTNAAAPVTFEGVVLEVDTSSRAGVAMLGRTAAGPAEARLMIGPVLRGTALRDALDFIQFTDFTNQIQFAAVADALNDRVLATTLAAAPPASLKGRQVRILGVAWREPGGAGALPLVVPVRLVIGDPQ
jgi:predicted lipoprotein